MALNLTLQEFRLLRSFIQEECGIFIGDDKKYLIEARLAPCVLAAGCRSFGEFYRRLKTSPAYGQLRRAAVEAITTHETLWFRDMTPFRILRESLLPAYQSEIAAGTRSRIQIWSAVCSTGQEPYSIAMSAMRYFEEIGDPAAYFGHVQIMATDISRSAIQKAARGVYDETAMNRGLPEAFRSWFSKREDGWEIMESLKRQIVFREFNLKDSPLVLGGPFDIVFLRNALIYFADDFKRTLTSRILRVISPGGYLFLGAGEILGNASAHFETIQQHGSYFYRRRTEPATPGILLEDGNPPLRA